MKLGMSAVSNKDSQHDEVVILVHGTFAGDDSDDGPRWWQRGSDTWASLQEKLPRGIKLQTVFHWDDGPNSARGRLAAALTLLNRLKEMEGLNQDYHLVGHSHGGSVIRECLQQAVIQRERFRVDRQVKEELQLHHLRSWTTIGTPFMQYGPAPIPLSGSRFMLWYRRWYAKTESWTARIRLLDTLQSVMALLLMVMLIALTVTVWLTLPNSATAYLVLGISVFFLFMVIFVGAFETQVERMQFHRERFAARVVAQDYGPRWLGLYSKDDEAIAGLKASLDIALKIVPKRTLANQVFHSDRKFRWLRPVRRIIYPLYNRIVPPLGDRFISSQLAKSAQGNDRPGTIVQQISTSPIPDESFDFPLPKFLNDQLVDLANDKAQILVPELRNALGSFMASGFQALGKKPLDVDLSAGLVHNSYFSNDDIRSLIVWHIAARSHLDIELEQSVTDPRLIDWGKRFSEDLEKHLTG